MRKPTVTSAVIVPALLLLLAGCQAWQPGGGTVTGKGEAFSLTTPAGWMYATSLGPDLLLSREGPILQRIVVEHRDLTKPPGKEPKRAITPTLAPFEVAEAIVDELRANRDLLEFRLQENTPATVGGRPGFRLVFDFRTKDGLQFTEARYGVIAGTDLWFVRFSAPTRHYFARDLPAFESAVQTLQFKKR